MNLKPGLGIAVRCLFLANIIIHPVFVDDDILLVIVASHDWKSTTGIGSVSPRIAHIKNILLVGNKGMSNMVGIGSGGQRWGRGSAWAPFHPLLVIAVLV